MNNNIRKTKCQSGAEKKRKRERLEAAAKSQKGALDRFVVKEPQINSVNQTPVDNTDVASGADVIEVDTHTEEFVEDDANINNEGSGANVDDDANADGEGNGATVGGDTNSSFQPDIFDPRNWDDLDPKMIDILLQKGPKRDLSIEQGPKDTLNRSFSAQAYNRKLPNKEPCDREWLVYSKELDKIFCFCSKLLKKGLVRGKLANEGFNDQIHLSHRLKEHETSREHVTNMSSWYDLRMRFQNNQTIDKVAQREL